MCILMSYQTVPMIECLITHITCIGVLTSMYALMCYQTAPLTECLTTKFTRIWMPTYITGISAFIRMYMKLFIESALVEKQILYLQIYSD